MAVCDGDYKFTMLDIGECSRQSDGGVFCEEGICINNKSLDFPAPEKLTHCDSVLPYVLIGDDAFPMGTNLMKPYPRHNLDDPSKLITNYRFSRARRIIENSFGILAARFRIFRRPIHAKVETVQNITKACTSLHNYLMSGKSFERDNYCPPGFADYQSCNGHRNGEWRAVTQNDNGEWRAVTQNDNGEWRAVTQNDNGLVSITQAGSHNYSKDAKQIRDDFCQYFNSPEGEVPWQYDLLSATRS